MREYQLKRMLAVQLNTKAVSCQLSADCQRSKTCLDGCLQTRFYLIQKKVLAKRCLAKKFILRYMYLAWRKYSQLTHWCTGSGRSLITRERNKMDAADCQRRCETSRPGCKAVEFWENELQKSYYYCFQCTDTSKITRYTNTNDAAYPVYVWVKGKKKKTNSTNTTL